MKLLFEQLGIAFCGLITTFLVVITNVTILHWTNWNLVGTAVNFIPVGAIVAGGIAASGYYFGALYSHSRASWSLLVLMVVIAGLADVSMYWYDYVSLKVADTNISEVISFLTFINIRLTSTHLRIGRGFTDVGEVGWFGYILGLRNIVGFLLGGFGAYVLLQAKTMCVSCNIYMDSLLERQYIVADTDAVASYFKAFNSAVMNGPGVPALLDTVGIVATPTQGALQITTELLGCPICKCQVAQHQVSVRAGDDWTGVSSLNLTMQVPPGIDLTSYIGG